jgi:hypothetical protein
MLRRGTWRRSGQPPCLAQCSGGRSCRPRSSGKRSCGTLCPNWRRSRRSCRACGRSWRLLGGCRCCFTVAQTIHGLLLSLSCVQYCVGQSVGKDRRRVVRRCVSERDCGHDATFPRWRAALGAQRDADVCSMAFSGIVPSGCRVNFAGACCGKEFVLQRRRSACAKRCTRCNMQWLVVAQRTGLGGNPHTGLSNPLPMDSCATMPNARACGKRRLCGAQKAPGGLEHVADTPGCP